MHSQKRCDSKSDSFQTDAAPFGSIRFLLTSKFPHLSKRQVGLVLTQGDGVALKGEPTSCKRAAAFKTEERVGPSNLLWILQGSRRKGGVNTYKFCSHKNALAVIPLSFQDQWPTRTIVA